MSHTFYGRYLRPLVYHRFLPYLLVGSVLFSQALFGYVYMADPSRFSISRTFMKDRVVVSVLDIGQGDSIFIQTPGGSMLVDAGPSNGGLLHQIGKQLPFYKNNVDMLLATHEDADHIGGFPALLAKYRTSLFFVSTKLTKTSIAASLQTSIDQKHIRVIPALRGMRITFHWNNDDMSKTTELQQAHLDILFPTKINMDELNTNDLSIVGRFAYASTSVMLTGDLPIASEQAIVKMTRPEYLKSDILKVGHHGSKNSSGDEFLRAVFPAYAVISVGAGNRYGHPNQEALDRIVHDTRAEILRTDKRGIITFASNGIQWTADTER